NDIDNVKELLAEHEVAAIILEPAASRSMTVPTNPAFLKALRQLTKEKGVVLIFDEVVTGFRLAPGGAQEYVGVTADMTCRANAAELGVDTYQMDEARLDRGMGAMGGKLHLALLNGGVDTNRGGGLTWLNAAMTDKDIDHWVDAFDTSLTRLKDDGALNM